MFHSTNTFSGTQTRCIHQIFEEQANLTPDQIAVICEQQKLTYAELNSRANQLAQYLQIQGVGAETLVAICVERSLDLAVGILGILKSGAAYLPLDPTYPQDRLAFMLADAQVPILVTQSHLATEINYQQAQVICLDTDWSKIAQQSPDGCSSGVNAENLAYVIYTSGSTGKPKGVMLTHANLSHYVSALQVELKLQADDIYLYIASIGFSSSRRQLLLPLTQGATVVIANEEERKDPFILCKLVKEKGITVMDGVPSFWRTYTNTLLSLEPDARANLLNNKLRLILSASESLLSDIPKTWMCDFNHPAHHVHMFGQTETSGIVCLYHITKESLEQEEKIKVIPVGQPIANTEIYILNNEGQPVGIDEPGEIYIAGAGVGRGYLNQPELTAAKFIENSQGIRLYKTGDWGKYLPDGNINYLSRQDYLIKIRGFRVELGEIEAVLITHPNVKQCVITAREDDPGNKRLVAYIVPRKAPAPAIKDLRNLLQQQLPDYMIPAAFVMLDALPFTPNGKVDRLALPAPEYSRLNAERTFVAPRDRLEVQLKKIWEQVLGVQPIGITDNFFELGGHSLLAVRLFNEIEKVVGRRLSLAALFQAQTIEELAGLLRQEHSHTSYQSLVPIQAGSQKKSPLFCIHARWGNVLFYRKLVRYLDPEQPVYALEAQGVDGRKPPRTSVQEMAKKYIKEIQKLQPEGPYYLGGFSFGGLVAFEIAQQLHTQGEKVAFLGLLDTHPPSSTELDSNLKVSEPQSLGQRIWLHISTLLGLEFKQQVNYLRDRLQWHFMAGKASIFYRLYLRYIKRSLSELRLIEVAAANNQARHNYVAKFYPGKITLFTSTDEAKELQENHQLIWRKLAREMEIYPVQGTHATVMEEPNVRFLAESLTFCLQQKPG